jgi:hypothetical protein
MGYYLFRVCYIKIKIQFKENLIIIFKKLGFLGLPLL